MGTDELTILAIDDDRDSLTAMCTLVQGAFPSAVLLAASNGGDGIALARAEDPDVILLGILPPDMDSRAVCQAVKSDGNLRRIPVVFLVRPGVDRVVRADALQAGADGFLAQPLDEIELTALIRAMAKIKAASVRDVPAGELDLPGETKFRSIAAQMTDMVFVTDTRGTITYTSPAVAQIFRVMPDQMIGRSFTDFLAAKDIPSALDAFSDALVTGQATTHLELTMRRQDGSVFPGALSGTRFRHEGMAGTIGLIRDLTEQRRAEAQQAAALKALQESEEQYRSLVENITDAIYTLDSEGRFTFVSPVVERFCKYKVSDLLGRRFTEFVHPEDLPALLESYGLTLRGEIAPLEYRVHDRDGTVLHIRTASRAIIRNGKVIEITGVITDVTERRRAEEARQESERRYRKLFEEAPVGIFSTTSDGRALSVNPTMARILGFATANEAVEHYRDLAHALYVRHERRLEFLQKLRECGTVENFEYEARTVDGRPIWLVMNARVSARRPDGSFTIEGFTTDITERKRVEEALRESEERYRIFINTTTDMVFLKDEQLRHLVANQALAAYFGKVQADVIGKTDSELMPAPGAAACHASDLKAIEMQRTVVTEQQVDGRTYETTKFPVPLRDGKTGVGGIIRDITERKRADDQLQRTLADLQRSNADLEQFAYVASHDLQEPLRMVASYVQLLQMRYQGQLDADADEFISYAVDGARRMQQLILDLLEYSRVGTRGERLQPTDAAAACSAAIADLDLTIQESRATVTCDPLPTVLADRMQLMLVFQNLIANALKFRGAEPPRVHISARLILPERSGGMGAWENGEAGALAHPPTLPLSRSWLFAVRDNGIGIDPRYHDRIFVIFQRLHTREAYEGTGIGLAVCKRIIERHSGRIWVESTPGQGATFYFTLPAAE